MNQHVTIAEPLCLKDFLASGAIVGEPRQGSRRFWTGREEKILREQFTASGLAGCLPVLPGRSAAAIYNHAGKLGLVSPQARIAPHGPRWSTSEHIDSFIRREYPANCEKGAVEALARRLGRPRWWVSKRAVKLGLVPPRRKEPTWSAREVELLSEHAHKSAAALRAILKRNGFSRTVTAVMVRLKREGFDRTDPHRLTARQLGEVMGVDGKTVTRWIDKGWLRAKHRGTDRVAAQGGDQWWIHRRDVARFVVDNVAMVDIRKVEKFWFVDLLAEYGGAGRAREEDA